LRRSSLPLLVALVAAFVILTEPALKDHAAKKRGQTMTQDTTPASPARAEDRSAPAQHTLSRRRRLWWGVVSIVTLGLIASAATLLLLTEAHDEIIEPQTQSIDLALLDQTHTFANPSTTMFMQAFTTLGSAQGLTTIVLLSAIILYLRRAWVEALTLIAALFGAGVLDAILKLWFHRDRPSVAWAFAREPTFSFPSGHATLSLVVFGMLLYLILRMSHSWRLDVMATLIALPLILAIGVSRVYLGVHYPSDILAGYLAGAIWLLAVILSLEALHRLFPTRILARRDPIASAQPVLASTVSQHDASDR
jgi:membrane-associated phospholipid phosphatase